MRQIRRPQPTRRRLSHRLQQSVLRRTLEHRCKLLLRTTQSGPDDGVERVFEFGEGRAAGWLVEAVEEGLGVFGGLVLFVELGGRLEGGLLAAKGQVVGVDGQLGRAAVRARRGDAEVACGCHCQQWRQRRVSKMVMAM